MEWGGCEGGFNDISLVAIADISVNRYFVSCRNN